MELTTAGWASRVAEQSTEPLVIKMNTSLPLPLTIGHAIKGRVYCGYDAAGTAPSSTFH
ncbi:MAG: hypothetical protein ACPH05_04450 [Luminiphilus sp.]